MIEIHESIYTPVTVNAVLGSVKKLPSEFTNDPIAGGAIVQAYSYGIAFWDPKLEFVAHWAKQSFTLEFLSTALIHMSGAIVACGILVIILSICYTMKLRNAENHLSKRKDSLLFK